MTFDPAAHVDDKMTNTEQFYLGELKLCAAAGVCLTHTTPRSGARSTRTFDPCDDRAFRSVRLHRDSFIGVLTNGYVAGQLPVTVRCEGVLVHARFCVGCAHTLGSWPLRSSRTTRRPRGLVDI